MIYIVLSNVLFSMFFARVHTAIGLDLFQTTYKEQRYEMDEPLTIKPALNFSYKLNNLVLGFRTNELLSYGIKSVGYDNAAEQYVSVKNKKTSNSLYLAYKHENFYPCVITTNVRSQTLLKYSSGTEIYSSERQQLFGAGLGYKLNRRQTVAFTIYLPSGRTVSVVGFSWNYYLW